MKASKFYRNGFYAQTAKKKNIQTAQALREMADWLETNAEDWGDTVYLSIHSYTWDKEIFKKKVKMLGRKIEKNFSDQGVTATKYFGIPNVNVSVQISRDQICEKVVTGTREVPEEIIPARTEEIIEWKCTDKAFTK